MGCEPLALSPCETTISLSFRRNLIRCGYDFGCCLLYARTEIQNTAFFSGNLGRLRNHLHSLLGQRFVAQRRPNGNNKNHTYEHNNSNGNYQRA